MQNIRFLKILFFFLLVTNYCFGQFRFANTDTNYYQITNRFYSQPYTGADTLDEGGPFAQFKKWELFWGPRLYPTGSFQAAKNAMNNYFNTTSSTSSSGNWTELAPFQLTNPSSGSGGVGRINHIAFHPDFNGTGTGNTNTIYAGACSGGLWRTQDGGSNWFVLNTDNLPLLGITSIEVDPNVYPSTTVHRIYIGTGQYSNVEAQELTTGIWKSDDDGQSWQSFNTNIFSSTINSGEVNAILVNPSNSNDVFAATSAGLYRTSNLDALSTCNWSLITTPGNPFIRKIVYKPNDLTYMNLYASGTDILKSVDGGNTWVSMTGSLFSTTPFTGQTIDGIHIAVTPAAPNDVYASIITRNSNGTPFHYFYKYDYSQSQWIQPGGNISYLADLTTDRLSIAVSPTNKDEIFIGQEDVWYSSNGGINFCSIAGYSSTSYGSAHSDIHDLQFSPSNELYMGGDGGFYKNINKICNAANNWTNLSNGLIVGELYHLGASPTNPDLVLVGLQDVGSYLLDNSQSPSQKWKWVGGGDGFEQIIAPNNQDMFISSQRSINHSADGCTSCPSYNNWLGKPCFAWTGNWDLHQVLEPSENKIYVGYNEIFKKLDYNIAEYNTHCYDPTPTYDQTWNNISSFANAPFLSCNAVVVPIAFAPSDKNYIYAATAPLPIGACNNNTLPIPSRLFKTKVGGGAYWVCPNNSCWEELIPLNPQAITSIAIHPDNPEKIWIAYSGYSSPYKVEAYDGTNTTNPWSDYSNGLPSQLPVNTIVYEKGSNDGLYAGTDVGVYYTNKDLYQTQGWILFNSGFPNVVVSELEINYPSNTIRAATYGRGLWESSLACPTNTNQTFTGSLSGFYEAQHVTITNASMANNADVDIRGSEDIVVNTSQGNVVFTPSSGYKANLFIHGCDHSGNSFRQQNNNYSGGQTNSASADIEKPITQSDNFKFTYYPNPFTDHLHIDFLLEKSSDVNVTVYNSYGQVIDVLAKGNYSEGEHTLIFDNSNIVPGVYFVRLDMGDKHYTKAVIKRAE